MNDKNGRMKMALKIVVEKLNAKHAMKENI